MSRHPANGSAARSQFPRSPFSTASYPEISCFLQPGRVPAATNKNRLRCSKTRSTEELCMRKALAVLATVAAVGATAAPAQARGWGWGPGIGLGLAAGALAAGAYGAYGPYGPYGYGPRYYGYGPRYADYGPGYYRP